MKAGDPHVSGRLYQLASPAVPGDHMPAGSDRWVIRDAFDAGPYPASDLPPERSTLTALGPSVRLTYMSVYTHVQEPGRCLVYMAVA